jgi:hypothetical protein
MVQSESYQMMEALRKHLMLSAYEVNGKIEIVLKFKTVDGKVHQICNTFVEKAK